MADFLQYLRQQNIFGPRPLVPPGPNAIPQPIPGMGMTGQSMPMGDMGSIPPPQFGMPGIEAPDVGLQNDPLQNVQFGKGPLDINAYDMSQSVDANEFLPQDEGMDAGARMRELYQPQDDATRRFEQLISQYPQEQKPSLLRRIGAMIVDYTKGQKAGQEFFDEPRNKAIQDWKNQISPAYQAATNERYANANERTLAYQQMSTELREKALQAKERNDIRRAEIYQQRADIYAFKTMHPNFKFILPKGGNVMAMDPATGESHDTGIPTGSLSRIDELNLTQENALGQIAARGQQAQTLEGMRQSGREGIAETRGWKLGKDEETGKSILYNEITGATKPVNANVTPAPRPGASGAGGIQPTQQRINSLNRATQLKNTRPDLAEFIKIGAPGSNDFEITPPSTGGWFGGSGPTQEQYDEMSKFIYGAAVGPRNTPPGGRGSMSGPGPAATPPQSRTIRVRTKDGKTYRFQGTPEEAQAAGYTVIGQ